MLIHRLRSFTEFQQHACRMKAVYEQRKSYEKELQDTSKHSRKIISFSYPAGKQVNLEVSLRTSDLSINWRESMTCPITGLNNRLRAAAHLCDSELGLLSRERIYLSEQVTPCFKWMKQRYPNLIGSEYLGDHCPLGQTNEEGTRNEDLTKLTFPSNYFDAALSFECLEHIPNFLDAFRELARVLKPDGRIMWSVPFGPNFQKNLIRASRDADGRIIHHEPPEYHGDPINSDGCLCFTHFGWEMLQQVKEAGFKDAYAVAYWSDVFGYLGVEQIIFVASKRQ